MDLTYQRAANQTNNTSLHILCNVGIKALLLVTMASPTLIPKTEHTWRKRNISLRIMQWVLESLRCPKAPLFFPAIEQT